VGHTLPDAEAARQELGPWEMERSLGHWVRAFRRATISAEINPISAEEGYLIKFLERVKNYLPYVASAALSPCESSGK
jgi:hypothetical protein